MLYASLWDEGNEHTVPVSVHRWKKRKFSIKWLYRVTNAGAQSATETQMRGQPRVWEGRVCKGFHGSGFYRKPHHRDLMQHTEVLGNEEAARRTCGFPKTTAMNSNYQYVTEWCKVFMEIETVGREQSDKDAEKEIQVWGRNRQTETNTHTGSERQRPR